MFKILLRRLRRQKTATSLTDELPAAPLTVFADEPLPAPDLIDVDHLFFPWLLGAGAAEVHDLSEAESRMLRALKREADDNDAATAELVPRLPAIIPVLLRSLRDRNVSNASLAAQVAQDAVLVAAVLRQVNSSWFRRASPVRTIEEALALIGQNGLRILVASVAFKPLFSANLGRFTGAAAPRVWALSEPYGFACRLLAARNGVDEFEAYLAGLLRNVGVIVALRLLDQAGGAGPGDLRSLAFHSSFAHYARRLARLIGGAWGFPAAAVAAAGTDLNTMVAAGPGAGGNYIMQRVVGKADRLAKLYVLARAGALREDLVDACLDEDDVISCWDEMAQLDQPGKE